MAERFELNEVDLDKVNGGAITWRPDGTCFARENPSVIYHFDIYQIDTILSYILKNNGGRPQDSATLEMLAEAGYVW